MFRTGRKERISLGRFLTPCEIAAAYDQGVEALFDPARCVAGFHSRLDALDKLAGGLRRGTLTFLSGMPGAGKTALALAYVGNAALVDGVSTAISSPACTSEYLLVRLLTAQTQIPLDQFTKHGLDAAQRASALEAWQRMSRSPLFINDSTTKDLWKLRWSLRALAQRSEVQFVVVDEVRADTPGGWFRRPAVAPELLAGVARELHVAVLALGTDSADNPRARWAQYAERIMELKPTSSDNQAEVLVQRNRFGPTGHVTLRFNADCLAFEDATSNS